MRNLMSTISLTFTFNRAQVLAPSLNRGEMVRAFVCCLSHFRRMFPFIINRMFVIVVRAIHSYILYISNDGGSNHIPMRKRI